MMEVLSYDDFLKESKDSLNELKNLKSHIERKTQHFLNGHLEPEDLFHAGGTNSNKLLIFDIDDTILTGEVYIKIVDAETGEYLHKVNSNQFNTYKLKPGEKFDFSEFADPAIFEKNKVTKYFDTMVREYKRGTHICLLTARGGKDVGEMIREYFLKRGVDIKEELVICINDDESPYTGTTAERKAQAIEDLVGVGYDTIIFFDDNKENLEEAKDLAKKIGFKLYTIHANIHAPKYEKYIRVYPVKNVVAFTPDINLD